MLQRLYIQHFALIDQLEVVWQNGFTVITGETGAGKSIMLGALGLLLGTRADSRQVKQGEQRCVVEATFLLEDMDSLEQIFAAADLDYDPAECTLRRELTAAGKSRAFINDTPVPLTLLKEVGDHLIDIHSQHQSLLLGKRDYQLYLLDTLADTVIAKQEYQQEYRRYTSLQSQLSALQTEIQKAKADEDYISFQLQQLDEAAFVEGEDNTLTEEIETLSHAEELTAKCAFLDNALNNDDAGVLNVLHIAILQASSLSPLKGIAERLRTSLIDIKDIAAEVTAKAEHIEHNPERLATLSTRLDLLYTLQQKHRVDTLPELLSLQNELKERISSITKNTEDVEQLTKEVEETLKSLLGKAKRLTDMRVSSSIHISELAKNKLQQLGMPNAQLQICIQPLLQPAEQGMDSISFLFSANKGSAPQPIANIASGGEMSRLMLVLKSMLADVANLPTIIFDEVDTGVSGEVADKMTQMMKKIAATRQVVCITHLPQMAAGGQAHYYVYKSEQGNTSATSIRLLNEEERVNEIAKMISGATLTPAALQHAKDLIRQIDGSTTQ